jgi:hypothetical protein
MNTTSVEPRTYIADASSERHIRITTQQSCRNDPGRSDEYQFKVNVVFFEQAGFLGNPRVRLRHDSGGVNADHFFRGREPDGSYHLTEQH